MNQSKVENNIKRHIEQIVDLEKIAWNLFECVDNEVPVGKGPTRGRLKRSATLIAGTNMLMSGGLPKHFATLMSRNVVSLTYSTPKPVGENARVFYMHGAGKWFDYAHKVEEDQHYFVSNIRARIDWIIGSAVKQR